MELRQLKYFISVAETLNFTRAAEILYISQPTLSKQISDLEENLGRPLFERTKRTVRLTPAGALFYEHAKRIVTSVDQASDLVRTLESVQNQPSTLRIGYERAASDGEQILNLVCQSIIRIKKIYPNFRAEFLASERDNSYRDLRDGTVDMYLCTRPISMPAPSWPFIKVMDHEFLLMCYTGEKLADTQENLIRVLSEQPIYLLHNDTHGMMELVQAFREFGLTPHFEFTDSIVTSRLNMCAGNGAIIIPSNLESFPLSDQLSVFTLKTMNSRLQTLLIHNPKCNSSAAQLLLDDIQNHNLHLLNMENQRGQEKS